MRRAWWLLGGLLAGCQCGSETAAPLSGSASGASAPLSAGVAPSQVVTHKGRTSSPEVALRNLSAQIEGQRKMMADRPKDLITRSMVFTLLVQRARILGATGDLIEGVEVAEKATEIEPGSFAALVLRGRGRAAASSGSVVGAVHTPSTSCSMSRRESRSAAAKCSITRPCSTT